MYSSFTNFDNYSLMDFIEKNGLKLDVQRGDRVFPKSEKSNDVIKLFERLIKKNNISLNLNEEVKSVKKYDKFIVKTSKDSYEFDKLVIATGGLSYPLTGSTGDGYKFAKNFSHKIIKPRPGLCPIKIKDRDLNPLNGISLKNVSFKVKTSKKEIEEFGDMLFGKDFITGPIVLTLSSLINKEEIKNMSVDLKPALDFEKLDKRIIRDIKKDSNKDIRNVLKKLLLNAFVDVVLKRAKISPHTKANQLTKEQRHRLIDIIKNFSIQYKSLADIKNAIITSGGISCDEIDPKNMESRLVSNLYFVGEVLDVDALTGGYNLQIAFSQAKACADDLRRKDG